MPYQIKLQNVTKVFSYHEGVRTVLQDCTQTFNQGMTYAITGPSGIGKTSLMLMMAGLDQPTKGDVLCNDQAINSFKVHSYIGFIPQSPKFFKELTVYQNCTFFIEVHAGSTQEKQKKLQHLDELFDLFQLHQLRNISISHVSRGQLQRIALIRALALEPVFLLADEPTANLDTATGMQVMDLLVTCQKRFNMGIIIASHQAYAIDRMEVVFELKDGTLSPSVKNFK